MSSEPAVTSSIIANIPSLLRATLLEICSRYDGKGKQNILISSNNLANKFIYLQWGIKPTQRKQYRNLFFEIRGQCRTIFQYFINRGEFVSQEKGKYHKFGVYKFDEVRGNLIVGFVHVDVNSVFL